MFFVISPLIVAARLQVHNRSRGQLGAEDYTIIGALVRKTRHAFVF